MKINEKDFEYIEGHKIYGNYCKYIEPIINYMASMDLPILNADSINEFIDNVIYNDYGFVDYNGNLYIVELAEDKEQLDDYNYFVDYCGDKFILIPIE